MRRRGLIVAGVAVLAILFALAAVWQYSNARTHQLFGTLVNRVDTSAPVVALTFDDGPTAGHTGPVLDIFAAHGVKATFFLTGRETEANIEEARAIVAAGHEIGNHSWSHSRMVLMPPSTVREEIERTDAAIRAAGYDGPIHFRPPYGKKLVTLPWYLAQTGRTTIMWDVEPEQSDAVTAEARLIAGHVIENASNGSIIILHVMYDSRQTTRDALPLIIEGLRARGFSFVTVSELLGMADAD